MRMVSMSHASIWSLRCLEVRDGKKPVQEGIVIELSKWPCQIILFCSAAAGATTAIDATAASPTTATMTTICWVAWSPAQLSHICTLSPASHMGRWATQLFPVSASPSVSNCACVTTTPQSSGLLHTLGLTTAWIVSTVPLVPHRRTLLSAPGSALPRHEI